MTGGNMNFRMQVWTCFLLGLLMCLSVPQTSAAINAPQRHELSIKNVTVAQSNNSNAKKSTELTPSVSPNPHHNATTEGMIARNIPKINSGALLRGFYVLVGLSVIVVMYLVVRSVRLHRKVSRVHKYGVLASREDVEMTPLGADDEDDDTIVFDLSSHPPP